MCSAVSTLESFLCIFGTYTNFLKTQEIATYVSNSLEIYFFFVTLTFICASKWEENKKEQTKQMLL